MPKKLQYYRDEGKRCLHALRYSIPDFKKCLQNLADEKVFAVRLKNIEILMVQYDCINAWLQRATEVSRHSHATTSRKLNYLCDQWRRVSRVFKRFIAMTMALMQPTIEARRHKKHQEDDTSAVVGCGCFSFRVKKGDRQKQKSDVINLLAKVGKQVLK